MRKLFLSTGLILVMSGSFAQTFVNYTKASSLLCNDTVLSLAIDPKGNKWFGTANGISEFDGTNWKTFDTTDGLAGNAVTCITIDTSGNKWFGTLDGISKFAETSWTNYLSQGYYTCLKADAKNNIWLTSWPLDDMDLPMSGTVLSKFNGTDWEKLDHSDEPYYSIAIDSLDNKWFSTPGMLISYDGNIWDSYYFGFGETMAIAFDSKGILWTSDAKRFDGDNFTDILENGMLGDFYFQARALVIDSKNNKWFGTDTNGVWKYNDTTWTNYTTKDGLASNHILSIAVDRDDNIWFGTLGGVSELVNDEVTQVKETDDPDIILYPVPVSDKLTISLSTHSRKNRIEIFSIDGMQFCSEPVYKNTIQLDMSKYPPGIYIVRLYTSNGNTVTRQIIKANH